MMKQRSLRLLASAIGVAIICAYSWAGLARDAGATVNTRQASSLKMVAPLEVGIVCIDIDRMLDFYTKVVGLELVADDQASAEMSAKLGYTADGYRIVRLQTPNGERIKLIQAKVPPQKTQDPEWVFDRQGLAFITFIVPDLEVITTRLRKQGVSLVSSEPVEVRKGVYAFMARDPEGNFVEFVKYADVASYRPDLYKKQ